MTDIKNIEDGPVDFSYPEGLEDLAEYCKQQFSEGGKSHFSISGINVDIDATADFKPTVMTLIQNIFWQ